MKCIYDWEEIQKFHDTGKTWREISEKFGVCIASIAKASKRGDFKPRNRSQATKLSLAKTPRTLSQETRDKISVSRKRFLEENPHMVPYLLNHYSKGDSYPEKYFEECLIGSNFVKKFRVNTYELDFADIERKIDLEIDGGQHTCDPRIVEHDIKRNAFLIEKGWKVIRINWPEFQKLDSDGKAFVVQFILTYSPEVHSAVTFFGDW